MAAPIVSWYSRDNSKLLTNWNIGTVDAGTISNEFGFLIWNNRTGESMVSTMTDCVVTVRDTSGGLDGNELVKGRWVEVKVDSLSEASFTAIGSQTASGLGDPAPDAQYEAVEKAIQCDKTAFDTAALTVEEMVAGDFTSPIGGFVNDGVKDNSKANFAEVTLRVNVPESAPAGSIDFLTRVRYSYV